ncbi:MAG: type II toxin-antitoxin system HicA family toxin [SAR202 cluster bacterium]|nr:type II toxin-antitoxin system HicA family toxin [SAR202 cluster bacterium]
MGTQRLPQVNGARVVRALRRAGWTVHRVHGSHHMLVNANRPDVTIVVPVHNRPVKKGLLSDILEQAGLSISELKDLL